MNPIKAIRAFFTPRSSRPEWWVLRERLDILQRNEDLALKLLDLKLITPDEMVEQVFEFRQRQIETLHALGWHGTAREREADLRWRREAHARRKTIEFPR
jgi:hypothetical protein